MLDNEEVMRSLGRIEGRLEGIESLSRRVSALESWAAWTKGGISLIAFALAYIFRGLFGYGTK